MPSPKKPNPMPLSERGKLGAKASPWRQSPMAVGWKALRASAEYKRKGKSK